MNIARKLASVRIVKELLPIENADRIEIAVVDGWRVIVKKGEFEVGQRCIYCEIDSFLPEKEEYEFLRKSSLKTHNDGTKGFRLRSMKMRGVISQGLLLPYTTGEVGDDLTETLGIKLFEAPVPACLQGDIRGMFPAFCPKTEECRAQNLVDEIRGWKGRHFHIGEKLDGCLDQNTQIITENGNLSIKNICDKQLSCKVLTYNVLEQKKEWKNITNHSIKTNLNNWYKITTTCGKILKLTGNHRVWCSNLQCYRMVQDLDGSEEILLKN